MGDGPPCQQERKEARRLGFHQTALQNQPNNYHNYPWITLE
jgi:hypothetical protein